MTAQTQAKKILIGPKVSKQTLSLVEGCKQKLVRLAQNCQLRNFVIYPTVTCKNFLPEFNTSSKNAVSALPSI